MFINKRNKPKPVQTAQVDITAVEADSVANVGEGIVLPERVVQAIESGGFSVGDLASMSDDEVLSINGIGRSSLSKIREAISE